MARAWSVEGLPPLVETAHAVAIERAHKAVDAALAAPPEARVSALAMAQDQLRLALEARRYTVRRRYRARWERAHRRTVACKVSLAEYDQVIAAAGRQGLTVSAWVRQLLAASGVLDAPSERQLAANLWPGPPEAPAELPY